MATISVGEPMIEKLETIDSYSTAQEGSKEKDSLMIVDNKNEDDKPMSIVTERDLVCLVL